MNKRLTYIDTAKGIGILLVILGHTYNISTALHTFIYSFHMPLFFIISGMTYNKEKYSNYSLIPFIAKKAKSYLIPYLGFSVINLFLVYLWNIVFNHSTIRTKEIKNYINGIFFCHADIQHMPNCTPIWFLLCLFWASILFYLIHKFASKYAIFIAIFSALIGHVLTYFNIELPWCLTRMFTALFFIQIGFSMKAFVHNHDFKYSDFIFLLLGLLATLIKGLTNSGNNYNILHLLTAIFISLFILLICKAIPTKKNGFLSWLGKNTLPIIGFNYFLRDLTTEIYYLFPLIREITITWYVSFAITTLSCVLLIKITNKVKMLFFKNRIVG